MSRLVIAFAVCAGLACGGSKPPTWAECYRGMTNNYQNQDLSHVDHCDAQLGVNHPCQDACYSYHQGQGIAESVLKLHCDGIGQSTCP